MTDKQRTRRWLLQTTSIALMSNIAIGSSSGDEHTGIPTSSPAQSRSTLTVNVMDADTDKPIEGAAVGGIGGVSDEGDTLFGGITDADGVVEIEAVNPISPYDTSFSREGYEQKTRSIDLASDQEITVFTTPVPDQDSETYPIKTEHESGGKEYRNVFYPDNATNYEARSYWKDDILSHIEQKPLGGGSVYVNQNDVPTRSDADQIITSASELQNACESSNKLIVWIDEPIDMEERRGIKTQNITIAGDRGHVNNPRSLIYTNATGYPIPRIFECEDNVRFTGLQLRGPSHDNWNNNEYPGYLPLEDGRFDKGNELADLNSDSIEVDNCEIWGWGVQAFRVWADPHIHHCYAHDNMMTSLGYFLTVYRGHPTIDHCFLDAHRHDINGFGLHDAGYTVINNVFGPSASSHRIDMHALQNNLSEDWINDDKDDEFFRYRAGGDCIIRNNTFCFTNIIHGPEMPPHPLGFDRGRWHWVYSNRGIPHPGTEVRITRNSIMHIGPQPRNSGVDGSVRNFTPYAFTQNTAPHTGTTTQGGFVRISHWRNFYDNARKLTPPSFGAPIDHNAIKSSE
ncbi:hypothetical protein HAPAU_36580 [Halalkalicoccus paucihalophilus]|uniref:Right handed beta helix domain-containing protein n=1 Tax=Halalkalicoccus paucihalophilus TaxID=1008153 RepID=A0A151A9Z7_9EURY|nr:hypothetical protein [Halalkalicoccus paucihalophilus]KYH24187.1 hypothetical protein HAPAU_36580 [Halalkalicoccus paucihalophilus]